MGRFEIHGQKYTWNNEDVFRPVAGAGKRDVGCNVHGRKYYGVLARPSSFIYGRGSTFFVTDTLEYCVLQRLCYAYEDANFLTIRAWYLTLL